VTPGERREALESVAAEVRACTRCRLHAGRTRAVPGEGSPETEVVFVGEAPGFNEDRQGRPFVGAAGSFLTELLSTVGWRREDVFITNVVKCRPPENRDPEPDEIAACAPFLARQLEIMDPALVVTLGRHSLGTFLPGARIGQVHGTARPPAAAAWTDGSVVYAMYHPAAALHQGSLRRTLLDDMQGIPRALLDARDRRALAAETVDAQVPAGVAPPGPGPAGHEPGADDDAVAFPQPAGPGTDQLTLFS
jgi:uracil-DNA glycosylase family 4